MVDSQGFVFEEYDGKNGENNEGDDLLDDFELPEVEGAAAFAVADTVCGDLEDVLEECDAPAEEDDCDKTDLAKSVGLFQTQVTVPGEGHESVGNDEQKDRQNAFVHVAKKCAIIGRRIEISMGEEK